MGYSQTDLISSDQTIVPQINATIQMNYYRQSLLFYCDEQSTNFEYS